MADQGGSSSGSSSAAARRKDPADARRKDPGATGRVTPKGTAPKGQARRATAPASGRYTPPVVHQRQVSPPWVPALMFALLGIGVLVIICNYLGILPGGSNNRYLLAGLAAITGGFVTATRYR